MNNCNGKELVDDSCIILNDHYLVFLSNLDIWNIR